AASSWSNSNIRLTSLRLGSECQIHSARSSPQLFPDRSGEPAAALRASGLRVAETAAALPPISTVGLLQSRDRSRLPREHQPAASHATCGQRRAARSPPPANNIPETATAS